MGHFIRIVTVSNSKIFDEPVYNYTREFPYIWEEMTLPITYTADRSRAERILLEVAGRHTVPIGELGEAALLEMERRYFIRRVEMTPKVYFRLTDNWLELTVRFIARDHGIRELKDAMSREILDGAGRRGDRHRVVDVRGRRAPSAPDRTRPPGRRPGLTAPVEPTNGHASPGVPGFRRGRTPGETMRTFDLIAILIVLAALFSYINLKVLKLPSAIGLMALTLLFSVAVFVAGHFLPVVERQGRPVAGPIRLQRGAASRDARLPALRRALHVDLGDLARHRWPIAALSTFGVVLSTAIVGVLTWVALRPDRAAAPVPRLPPVRGLDLAHRPDRRPRPPQAGRRPEGAGGPDRGGVPVQRRGGGRRVHGPAGGRLGAAPARPRARRAPVRPGDGRRRPCSGWSSACWSS